MKAISCVISKLNLPELMNINEMHKSTNRPFKATVLCDHASWFCFLSIKAIADQYFNLRYDIYMHINF